MGEVVREGLINLSTYPKSLVSNQFQLALLRQVQMVLACLILLIFGRHLVILTAGIIKYLVMGTGSGGLAQNEF